MLIPICASAKSTPPPAKNSASFSRPLSLGGR
jgi:hypothetical protein